MVSPPDQGAQAGPQGRAAGRAPPVPATSQPQARAQACAGVVPAGRARQVGDVHPGRAGRQSAAAREGEVQVHRHGLWDAQRVQIVEREGAGRHLRAARGASCDLQPGALWRQRLWARRLRALTVQTLPPVRSCCSSKGVAERVKGTLQHGLQVPALHGGGAGLQPRARRAGRPGLSGCSAWRRGWPAGPARQAGRAAPGTVVDWPSQAGVLGGAAGQAALTAPAPSRLTGCARTRADGPLGRASSALRVIRDLAGTGQDGQAAESAPRGATR